MSLSEVRFNQGLNEATHINKEAVQRIHEQIFGNPFSLSNGTRSECSSSHACSQRIRFPYLEFGLKNGSSYTIVLNKSEHGNYIGFYFDADHANRVFVRFRSFDFSLGFLPGDMILSVNDVDFQQLDVDEINMKLTSKSPSELKLVVVPSAHSVEWSMRSIYVDYSCSSMLLNKLMRSAGSQCTNYVDLLRKQEYTSNRICLRDWIKQTGSLNEISGLIEELYLNLLLDSTPDPKGFCCSGDLVLVTHRDGYSTGKVTEILSEDMCQVELLPNKQLLAANLDDISRTNREELEGMEDLILLQHLNEVALVFDLHARILNALPYTYVGDFALLAFNPMRSLDIYNDAVKHLFFKCQSRLDMPPHVYSVAQTIVAHIEGVFRARGSLTTADAVDCPASTNAGHNRSSIASLAASTIKVPTQFVCMLGRSGSGKSANAEYVIEYLLSNCLPGMALSTRKVRAVMCLLDAFTCSRTLLNSNASRCLRLYTVEFTANCPNASAGQLSPSSLLVDILLLDKFRVTRRPQGEPTFHVFYYFLAGLEDDLRAEFMLEDLTSPNLFMTPLQRPEDQALAKSRWQAVHEAARVLGATFEEAFIHGVCRLLAVIYHLGCAGATPLQTDTTSVTPRRFINRGAAERAVRLLGCASIEKLIASVFGADFAKADSNASQTPSNLEFLSGFISNIYAIATNALRDLINKALNPGSGATLFSSTKQKLLEQTARVVVVDPPGLQTPEAGGRMSGGSFEDLLYNYTNECLLQLYRDCQCQADESGNVRRSNSGFVEFLDNPPDNPLSSRRGVSSASRPSLLKNSDSTSRTCSATLSQSDEEASITWTVDKCDCNDGDTNFDPLALPGLLWLLDYACCTGDMKTFIRLAAQKYANHKRTHVLRDSRLLRRLHRSGAFSLNHWNATVVVQYHPSTWLPSCHYQNSPQPAINLLQQSNIPLLRSIGNSMDEGASASTLSVSSSSGLVESFIQDTKYVMNLIRTSCLRAVPGERCDVHWIYCLLPVASAGLWQVASTSTPTTTTTGGTAQSCLRNPQVRFCVPLVRAQLHAISLATDLVYFKPAFIRRLLRSTPTTSSNLAPTANLQPILTLDSVSPVTELPEQGIEEEGRNSETDETHLDVPNSSTGDKLTQYDFAPNHTLEEPADTYNFVFNSTSSNFPWEQLLSLAPIDRGLIKQLRIQLEEMEESKELLLRRQRILTADLEECQQQLNQEKCDKRAAELRYQATQRQKSDLQCRVEDLEEKLEEVNRMQRRSALTSSTSSPGFNSYASEMAQLVEERNAMREEIDHLQERLTVATTEKSGDVDMELVYLKAKIHELEGRLELETSIKQRLQSTVERLRGQLEKQTKERDGLLMTVQAERQNARHFSRSLREALEDKERAERRLAEEEHRRCETSNEVSSCVQEQLRLQQELSHLLLRCKEKELRSMLMHRGGRLSDGAEEEGTDVENSQGDCLSEVVNGSDDNLEANVNAEQTHR